MNGKAVKKVKKLYHKLLCGPDKKLRPDIPVRVKGKSKQSGNPIGHFRTMKRLYTQYGGGEKGLQAAGDWARSLIPQ